MDKIFVTPKPGLLIRNPFAEKMKHLPAAGLLVADNKYWRRLARQGDVTITAGPAPAAPASAPQPAPKAKPKPDA